MKQIFLYGIILLIFMTVGCGRNVKVNGKVTFPDGSPLDVGKVVFETENFVASGELQSDGSYTLGSVKVGDGIPPGTYRVSVAGAMKAGQSKNITFGSGNVTSTVPMMTYMPVIAPKYSQGDTSGITCEVTKSMTFDFEVEPPK